jgi:hypothetical protein
MAIAVPIVGDELQRSENLLLNMVLNCKEEKSNMGFHAI